MVSKIKKEEMCQTIVKEIINEVEYLLEDRSIPKNISQVIKSVEERLKQNLTQVEVSTILYELEDTANGINAPEYRSVVWSLISKLETLKENMK